MAKLSQAARDMFVQLPEVQGFVADGTIGSDTEWPEGWVFVNSIIPAILDNKSALCLVVFSEKQWMEPNADNTGQFPLLIMDIWASPTRDSRNSITDYDADDRIEAVFKSVRPYFHTVDRGVPGRSGDPDISYMGSPGMMRYWGTSAAIADKSGYPIFSSTHITSTDFLDVEGGNGVRFRSHQFGIETA